MWGLEYEVGYCKAVLGSWKWGLVRGVFSSPLSCPGCVQEGTSRQRSGKGAIRKRFPLQKPRWEKTKLTIRYLYHETYRKPNEQLFPNRWPLSYLNN